jgi:hypothetical protein
MLKLCKQCSSEYETLTGKGNFCSKSCKNKYWYTTNKDHKKQYYVDNFEKIQSREKSYTLNGTRKQKNNKFYKTHSDEIKLKKRQYNKNNRDKINAYHREYYKDINRRLRKNLRGRLSCAIRRGFDGSRGGSFVKELQCSIEEFKSFIENKWLNGMNWDNYGWGDDKWHLDHIQPLIKFDLTNPKEFVVAAYYKNYQPLWQKDNFRKGAK